MYQWACYHYGQLGVILLGASERLCRTHLKSVPPENRKLEYLSTGNHPLLVESCPPVNCPMLLVCPCLQSRTSSVLPQMTSTVGKKYPGSWGESACCGQFSAIITGIKNIYWDFPSGPVVKNSPASAGDTGSIPGQGIRSYMSHGMAKLKKKNPAANTRSRDSVPVLRRFHMQRGNQADLPQLRSLHSRAHKSQLLNLRVATTDAPSLKPVLLNRRSHHSKSVHH